MLNPWVIIGFMVSFGAAVVGSYMKGHSDGVDSRLVAEAKQEKIVFREAQRLQRDADQVAIDLAGQQSVTQEKIVTRTMTITKEIPTYVKDTSDCVTIGLIRVLDAAALGVDPATLVLAPGQFDETCAGIGARALAQSVVDNYGRARQNAAQLTDLQALARRMKAVLDSAARPEAKP